MKKILIVDDEPDICDALSEFLKDAGYKTLVAHGGKEALDKTWKENPDLLILDIAMPDMEGTVVYETLRKDPRSKNVKVIFLTALASGAPQQFAGVDRSAYSLLSKPARAEMICREIERLLSLQ